MIKSCALLFVALFAGSLQASSLDPRWPRLDTFSEDYTTTSGVFPVVFRISSTTAEHEWQSIGMCEEIDLKFTVGDPNGRYLTPGTQEWVFDVDLLQVASPEFAARLNADGVWTRPSNLLRHLVPEVPKNFDNSISTCDTRVAGGIARAVKAIRFKYEGYEPFEIVRNQGD